MASGTRVVAVVRHRGAVLSCRGTDGALTPPSAAVAQADPRTALQGLLDDLVLEGATVERRGEPVDAGPERLIPFLVGLGHRDPPASERCRDPTWLPPDGLRSTGPDRWWRAYSAVAPTVETVAADTERGSTAIAVDALWALRDAATCAAAEGAGLPPVESVAADLLAARPSMAALATRINRAMARADTPAEVEAAATTGIERAHEADCAAAQLAAEAIDGGRTLTLSRSGTVLAALLEARPPVEVLASLPGGEGRAVAAELADAGVEATVVADAAVYDRLRSRDIATVLVGADAITPGGGVVNKVGTRAAALAAGGAGVPCYTVCASDKIRPTGTATEGRPVEPLFDWTPPELVTAVLTERGRLNPTDIREIADEHRRLATWRS